MTKLERRIVEVAEAAGRNVYVGRKGHKEDWFAGCDGVEVDGPSALSALEGVVGELRRRSESTEALYRSQALQAERLRAL